MFQNDLKRVIAYSTCSQLGWKKSAARNHLKVVFGNELYKSGNCAMWQSVSAFPILLKRSYSCLGSNNPRQEETFELEIESIIKKIKNEPGTSKKIRICREN